MSGGSFSGILFSAKGFHRIWCRIITIDNQIHHTRIALLITGFGHGQKSACRFAGPAAFISPKAAPASMAPLPDATLPVLCTE